jgi:hypothetical protein
MTMCWPTSKATDKLKIFWVLLRYGKNQYLYCAVGFQNKKVFVANARGSTVGVHGSLGYTPHLVLSCTLVVDHTFSGFRIASRGTSTVSEC